MEADVEVAEHEPALPAPGARRLERLPRLAGPPPAALGVVQARRGRRGRSRGRARRRARAPRGRRRRCRRSSARPAPSTSCSPAASLAPPTPPERRTTFTRCAPRDLVLIQHKVRSPAERQGEPLEIVRLEEVGERVDVVLELGDRGRRRGPAAAKRAALPGAVERCEPGGEREARARSSSRPPRRRGRERAPRGGASAAGRRRTGRSALTTRHDAVDPGERSLDRRALAAAGIGDHLHPEAAPRARPRRRRR